MNRASFGAVCSVVIFLFACGDDDSNAGEPTQQAVLYYEHIAPLIADNCLGCHVRGGIAPFQLTSYAEVKALGPLIADAVADRRMPPFLPDNSGACAEYEDALWLSDEQIATVQRWVDDGMLEGDAANAPEQPSAPPTLDATKTHEAWMPVEYMPNADLEDDYRCFIFDSDITGDDPLYVEEYEVVPGEVRVVHHLIVYQPNDAAQVQAARDLDDAEPGPGYSCFGASGVNARMLMNWAPGTPVVKHPEGTGVTIDPKLPFVVQLHYNLANGALPDQTRVRMKIAEQVDKPVSPWFYGNFSLSLPPGEELVISDEDRVFDDTYRATRGGTLPPPMTIVGVRAHMHQLGTAMRVERTDGETGEVSCLVNIPRYDFNWQRSYFLKDSVQLNPGDKLRVRCEYNTMGRTEETVWGEGTGDEMCLATLYTYDRGPAPEGPEVEPAVEDPSCPHYVGEVSGMMIDLPGCCSSESVCGVISSLSGSCITTSTILTDLQPGPACTPAMAEADAGAD